LQNKSLILEALLSESLRFAKQIFNNSIILNQDMVSRATVLTEGYVREEEGVIFASSTTVLIEDNGLKVLVDPGANREVLIDALEKETLKPEDIDLVFLTHYHPDHTLNLRLFPRKKVLDGGTIYYDDKEETYEETIPGTEITVIKTPGHTSEHCSLMLKTERGRVCVAGDLFWWAEKEEPKMDQDSVIFHEDKYATDFEQLRESRKEIIDSCDYIIPGHGRTFKTADVLRESTFKPSEFTVSRTEDSIPGER
jgi:glyoxylase-like metal-dependent hydrolase (beta-lactamase superfamily II)